MFPYRTGKKSMNGGRAKALRREANLFRVAFNSDAPEHLQLSKKDAEGVVKNSFKDKRRARKKKVGRKYARPERREEIRNARASEAVVEGDGWDL